MSNTIVDYQNLVTSEHQQKPKFMAVIALIVSIYVQIQFLMESMIDIFDLDLAPAGNQLDIIGQWVGVSRIIDDPFVGVYFSWDDVSGDGWDFGVWQVPGSPSELVSLPDDIYLTLIRAKIAANNWDGTTEGAYTIWDGFFPQYNLLIQDYQNMTFAIAIQGSVPDTLTLALLTGGYLPLKPEGVRITEYIVPVDTNPLFAWDCDSSSLAGWDTGSWGRILLSGVY